MIRNTLKSVTMLQLLFSISLVNATNSTSQLNDMPDAGITKQLSQSPESSDGTAETSLDNVLKIDELIKQLSKSSGSSDGTDETSLDDVLKINDTKEISELSGRRRRYLNRKDYYAAKLNSMCEESQDKEQDQTISDECKDSENSNIGYNNTTYHVNQFDDEDEIYEDDYNIGFNKEYSAKQLNEQSSQISEQLNRNKTEERNKKKSIGSFFKHLFNK